MAWLDWVRSAPGRPRAKGRKARTLALQLEELEIRQLLSSYHFDFGTSTSPVAAGYTGVPLVSYSPSQGYGWQNLLGISAVDRGGNHPLTEDFHQGTNATFLVNMPNGTYDVTPTLGDSQAAHNNVTISAQGQVAESPVSTLSGHFIYPTFRVQVSNGQLSLNFSSTTSTFALAALDINPAGNGPYSLWTNGVRPVNVTDSDSQAVELGVKFTSDVAGSITGIRFYKGPQNTGTHVGHLWTSSGNLLAVATFTNETASGWQQVLFSTPVAISANTTYVASYHTNVGHYSDDTGYFTNAGASDAPLHALGNSVSPDGVYKYGSGGFPTQTYQGSNYYVDVLFTVAASTPPAVTATAPVAGAIGIITGSVTATFNEALDPTTVNSNTFYVYGPSNQLISGAVTYNATTFTATFQPTLFLAAGQTFAATAQGGSGSQVIKDLAGDPLANNVSWSFTTAATYPPSPVANAGSNLTGAEGSVFQFAGSATGGANPLTYGWNFGDGSNASGSLTPTHTYNSDGTFTATLTVTDLLGRQSQSNTTIVVTNVAPTVNVHGPYTGAPGSPITFSATATVPDPNDTLTYSWKFGDGGTSTLQNPSHTYANSGNFTVALTVTDQEGASTSTNTTASVAASSYLITPYLSIPNFGANPTIVSVASGNWSNVNTWSLGRLPTAGDIVSISSGTTVTFDEASTPALNTVAIQGGGALDFNPNVNTDLQVGNLLVLLGGTLQVGTAANPIAANVMANIVIANQPINTSFDPEQFGTGVIVLGTVVMHGAAKTPYATLSQEAHAGDTVLRLATPVSGWMAGDDLVLPDTRQLTGDGASGYTYKPQWEQITVQTVSSDGLTVTLGAPLQFDHLGARDANGVLDYLPQVMNNGRNIMVSSASMTGTRGYTLYTDQASVDIEYAGFCELGRTTNNLPNNTTFDSHGNVTHQGTNEADRYAMTMLDLMGPTVVPPNGYQFTLIGNVVDNDGDGNTKNPSNIQWGIAINNSYYGLIKSNNVWSVAGVGMGVEDASASYNVFDHNMVVNVTGSSVRLDQQLQGDAFWFHNPNNTVTNNIAADINGGSWDVFSYGYVFDGSTGGQYGGIGTVAIASYQGADPALAGQSKNVNMNDTPLLDFANNEVYGATQSGMTLWWIGTFGDTFYTDAQVSVVKNFIAWNFATRGFYGYPTNNVTIDGLVIRGDESQLSNPYNYVTGVNFDDYMTRNLVIQNADIQGMATGIESPFMVGRVPTMDTTVIQNSTLINTDNIDLTPPRSVNGSGNLSPMTLDITNIAFGHPNTAPHSSWYDISMTYVVSDSLGTSNFSIGQNVVVTNYNDIQGDNFSVYYVQNHPTGAKQMALILGYVK
jgi:hypothetical protein